MRNYLLIKYVDDSKVVLILPRNTVTVWIHNDHERFILYRDLVLFISLSSMNEKSADTYNINKEYINEFVNYIIKYLDTNRVSMCLGYGYAGIGYMFYVLNYITKQYKDMISKINKVILDYINFLLMNCSVDNTIINSENIYLFLDYFKGLIGIFNYLEIANVQHDNIKQLLLKICDICLNVRNYENCSSGIAHGYSGLLLYLYNTKYLSSDDKEIIFNRFINKTKYLSNNSSNSEENCLYWGNGEYGRLYVLLLIKKILKISFKNEKEKLLFLFSKGDICIPKKNICSGIYGTYIMSVNLYDNYIFDQEELHMFIDILRKVYKKTEIPTNISVKKMSIINGILAEEILGILNNDKNNIYYKFFMI